MLCVCVCVCVCERERVSVAILGSSTSEEEVIKKDVVKERQVEREGRQETRGVWPVPPKNL